MTPFELDKTLSTMVICVDSREHATSEAKNRWESFGVPYRIQALKSIFSIDIFVKIHYNEYGGGYIEVSKARTFREKIRTINSY